MKPRLLLRDIVASWLQLLPLAWLDTLRHVHDVGRTSAVLGPIRKRLLRLLRLRRLDPDIADFCPPDRPDVRFKNVDSVLMRRLYWLGQSGYEASESRCWECCCSQSGAILEIGANVGLYTVFGASAAPDAGYTAIEPLSANFETLCDNVKLNDLENVEVIRAAVVGVKRSEQAELLIPENDRDANPAGAFLADSSERRGHRARSRETVRLIEARELFEGVDLVKLDVEGSEYDILYAVSARILQAPPTLFVEILPQANRLRRLLAQWCRAAGFRALVPVDGGLVEITAERLEHSELQQEFGARDVILSTNRELIAALPGWLRSGRTDLSRAC